MTHQSVKISTKTSFKKLQLKSVFFTAILKPGDTEALVSFARGFLGDNSGLFCCCIYNKDEDEKTRVGGEYFFLCVLLCTRFIFLVF